MPPSRSNKKQPRTNAPRTRAKATKPPAKATAKGADYVVAAAAASSQLPSSSLLLQHSQQTTEEWYKAARTKKGYENYVKAGKKWLLDWTAEDRLGDEISADAFDVITAQTALALRALTAYKCDHLERGFASAEGIRSAFKDYFERVCGCQGDVWRLNAHTQKWEGNPVFETGFKTYYESLKNRQNRTGVAMQALPMLPADLKVIMDYLDGPDALKYFTLTQRLYFKAFVTTAFTLWTRNDELVNLQFKDIKFDLRSKTNIAYHEFSLVFRKTNKDPTKAQKYMVQIDLAHPEMDCFTHVKTWKAHMETILRRPLASTDYVFPALASTGQIKFGEPTSRSAFETLLDNVVERSNVLRGRNGKFTTHCFRRGGAQYRFLWAERKWSLKAVKWWGGWSSNENVGTLMRYLLDELMAYEEGFSDIMMDDRVVDRHETFMGGDEHTPVSRADLARFEAHILETVRALAVGPSGLAGAGVSQPTPPTAIEARSIFNMDANSTPLESDLCTPSPNRAASQSAQTPRAPQIPTTSSLDDALTYWEHGAPRKGVDIPLKDWCTHFKPAEYASEAVKLGNIRFVCEEFQLHCSGDFTKFESKFPGLRTKFTMLMKAVRVQRKLRGEARSRNGRK